MKSQNPKIPRFNIRIFHNREHVQENRILVPLAAALQLLSAQQYSVAEHSFVDEETAHLQADPVGVELEGMQFTTKIVQSRFAERKIRL